MAWIESHVEIGEHPKIFKLMELLNIDAQKAVGAVHLLWHFAMKYAWRDGDLEKFGEAAIAKGSKWDGDPKKFIEALQESGFLDGLSVHDWMDCAGRLVSDRLYNEKRRKIAHGAPLNAVKRRKTPSNVRQYGATNPTNPTNPTLPTIPTKPTISNHKIRDTDFDRFWELYPKKIGKGAAEAAWIKAKDKPLIDLLLQSVMNQTKTTQWTKDGGQFIPNPATWLNQKRWGDDAESYNNGEMTSAQRLKILEEAE